MLCYGPTRCFKAWVIHSFSCCSFILTLRGFCSAFLYDLFLTFSFWQILLFAAVLRQPWEVQDREGSGIKDVWTCNRPQKFINLVGNHWRISEGLDDHTICHPNQVISEMKGSVRKTGINLDCPMNPSDREVSDTQFLQDRVLWIWGLWIGKRLAQKCGGGSQAELWAFLNPSEDWM